MKKNLPRVPEAWIKKTPVQAKFQAAAAPVSQRLPAPAFQAPTLALVQRKAAQTAPPPSAIPVRTPAVPPAFARMEVMQMKPAPDRQVQPPTQPVKPVLATMAPAAARTPRFPVARALPVQRSRAAPSRQETKAKKGASKQMAGNFTLTHEALDDNSFLYAIRASGPTATVPANTESKMTIKTFLSKDLGDAGDIRKGIQKTLASPTQYRNLDSESPIHNNLEDRLPKYNRAIQPNLEYLSASGKGGRIVVDVKSGNVYFSHHYGDDTVKAAKDKSNPKHVASVAILKAMGNTSAHVLLDPNTWILGPIVLDARAWWRQIKASLLL